MFEESLANLKRSKARLQKTAMACLTEEGLPRYISMMQQTEKRNPTEAEVKSFGTAFTTTFVDIVQKMPS